MSTCVISYSLYILRRRNYLYLSDVASGIIMRTSLNGSSPEILLTLQFEYIGELYKCTTQEQHVLYSWCSVNSH